MLGIPVQVIIMLVIVALAAWTLHRTVFGKQILAIGGNEAAARLSGVRVERIKRLVYLISGLCSGIAGLIVIARNSASDSNLVGLGVELDAIAAVAVGGTLLTGGRATVIGTLVGALIIQLVRFTLLANGVPDAAALGVKAGLIALAVWLQRRVDGMSATARFLRSQGVLLALALLILFGAWRYDNFLGPFNILTFLRYNSMFALIALGMCFVIMTGGIDLSVGSTAAMSSVVVGLCQPARPVAGARRRRRRRARGRRAQRHPDHAPRPSALHRNPRQHAGGEQRRPPPRRQSVDQRLLRQRLHRDRPGRPAWLSDTRPGSRCSPTSSDRSS